MLYKYVLFVNKYNESLYSLKMYAVYIINKKIVKRKLYCLTNLPLCQTQINSKTKFQDNYLIVKNIMQNI